MRNPGERVLDGLGATLAQVAFIGSIVTVGFLLLFDVPW